MEDGGTGSYMQKSGPWSFLLAIDDGRLPCLLFCERAILLGFSRQTNEARAVVCGVVGVEIQTTFSSDPNLLQTSFTRTVCRYTPSSSRFKRGTGKAPHNIIVHRTRRTQPNSATIMAETRVNGNLAKKRQQIIVKPSFT
jgi:hypothetical protein